MNHKLKLVLLLAAIASSNLVSQELFREKYSASHRYRSELFGSLEDLLDFDTESIDASKDSSSEKPEDIISDSGSSVSSEEFDNDLNDPIQRETYISQMLKAHKCYMNVAEYELLALLTKGISKDDITKILQKCLKGRSLSKELFLERFYYCVFKYQRKHNINAEMRNLAITEQLKLPYMVYLNKKHKTNFSLPVLVAVLNDSHVITQQHLELAFLKTSQRLDNLEPNETAEQLLVHYVHAYINQQNDAGSYQESSQKTPKLKTSNLYQFDIPHHCITAQQENVIQLDVYQQEDASCGYQALRNAFLITQMLRGRITQGRVLGMLSEEPSRIHSDRVLIKIKRLKEKFTTLLYQILVSKLISRESDTGRALYTILPNIAPSIIRTLEIKFDCNIITPNMIISAVQEEVARQIVLYPTNGIFPQLAQSAIIQSHFPQLQEIHIVIQDDRLFDHLSQMSISFESDTINLSDFKMGNWINQEEIKFILRHSYKDMDVIVIGDVGQAMSLGEQLEIETEQKERLLDPNTPIKTVICYMNDHWIACVIHKRETHYEYYLANSLNNISIVNHPLILELKELVGEPSDKPKTQDEKKDFSKPADEKTKMQFTKSPVNFSHYYTPIPPRVREIVRSWQENRSSNNIPYSMVLYGDPGTGKSLLAQAIAGELDAYFYQIVASNTLKKYYGESEEFINNLFRDALEIANDTNRPIVIFFDEVDAVTADSKESARKDILHTIHQFLDNPLYKNKILFISATNSMHIANSFESRNANCIIHMPKLNLDDKIELITHFAREYNVTLSDKQIQNLARSMHDLSQREVKAIFVLADQKKALAKADIVTIVFLEEALEYHMKEKADTNAFKQKAETKQDWQDFKKGAKQGFASTAGSVASSTIIAVATEGAKLGIKALASRLWR